jgi:hypothetical protein
VRYRLANGSFSDHVVLLGTVLLLLLPIILVIGNTCITRKVQLMSLLLLDRGGEGLGASKRERGASSASVLRLQLPVRGDAEHDQRWVCV